MKLASELQKRSTGRTVYVLDEPTTGLHFEDIRKLLLVLESLVDKGNTVIVIEHNLDVIKTADWLIDMGPEGGHKGGLVLAIGTPEELAEVPESHTGAVPAAHAGPDRRRREPGAPARRRRGRRRPTAVAGRSTAADAGGGHQGGRQGGRSRRRRRPRGEDDAGEGCAAKARARRRSRRRRRPAKARGQGGTGEGRVGQGSGRQGGAGEGPAARFRRRRPPRQSAANGDAGTASAVEPRDGSLDVVVGGGAGQGRTSRAAVDV